MGHAGFDFFNMFLMFSLQCFENMHLYGQLISGCVLSLVIYMHLYGELISGCRNLLEIYMISVMHVVYRMHLHGRLLKEKPRA